MYMYISTKKTKHSKSQFGSQYQNKRNRQREIVPVHLVLILQSPMVRWSKSKSNDEPLAGSLQQRKGDSVFVVHMVPIGVQSQYIKSLFWCFDERVCLFVLCINFTVLV